jgi:hypothetical protein
MTDRRRFPPPWSVEERPACYIVKGANGFALAHVYFEEEPGRRAAPNLMTQDEARRIASNIAKLPDLQRKARHPIRAAIDTRRRRQQKAAQGEWRRADTMDDTRSHSGVCDSFDPCKAQGGFAYQRVFRYCGLVASRLPYLCPDCVEAVQFCTCGSTLDYSTAIGPHAPRLGFFRRRGRALAFHLASIEAHGPGFVRGLAPRQAS